MLVRPNRYNTILDENEHVYASYTNIEGTWMGGLFAKRDLCPGQPIARYMGREYEASEADKVEDQSFMFTATVVRDRRRRVVIDGNPALYENLAGYANYAEGDAANAIFVDQAASAGTKQHTGATTNIWLRAAAYIPAGTELRVDYDMGSSQHPFRDQMLKNGVSRRALRVPSYQSNQWKHPNVPVVNGKLLSKRMRDVVLVEDVMPVQPFRSPRRASRSPKRSHRRSPKRSPSNCPSTTHFVRKSKNGKKSCIKKPKKSPKKSKSPSRSSSKRSQSSKRPSSPQLKRPRGRPPKGKRWDSKRGYVNM